MNTTPLAFTAPPAFAGGWFAGLIARLRGQGVTPAPAMPYAATELSLKRSELLRVRLRPGREIRCLQGCLWLTFDGNPSDVLVDAGECFRGDAVDSVLISALRPARFQVR